MARTSDPLHKLDCQRNLTKIYDALRQYQHKYNTIPTWLSDLHPEFISDAQVLHCPYIIRTGDLSAWRDKLLSEPGNDPLTYYHYEFCLEKARHVLPEDSDRTFRQYKEAQMVFLGTAVPIVRCLAHNPVLNLAWNGMIYENIEADYWEESFSHLWEHELSWPPLLFPAARHVQALLPQPLGETSEGFRLLDLSAYFHIRLHELPPNEALTNKCNLASLPKGVQKIGGISFRVHGVVHLTRNSRNLPFPTEVEDIVVRQRCSKLHLLHGSVFSEASAGETAQIIVLYSDGSQQSLSLHSAQPNGVTERNGVSEMLVWQVTITAKGVQNRAVTLYRSSWDNPFPEREIAGLTFVSAMTEAAPFLLAVSIE